MGEAEIRRTFIPGKITNPMNGAQGRGWRTTARERKDWRRASATAGILELRFPQHDVKVPKRVTVTAFVHNRFDSHDGLRAALKPVIDGLGPRTTKWRRVDGRVTPVIGLGADVISGDEDQLGNEFHYAQQIDRKRPGVLIEVEVLGA